MIPEIKNIASKKLVGKKILTSLANDRTVELWKDFVPEIKIISNKISGNLYSVQVFSKDILNTFNAGTVFEKWAAVEVTTFEDVPASMAIFIIPAGDYAVFVHKGQQQSFDYIYKDWLPKSGYTLDDRPHFAVMGEKYKNDDPNSEEEIWIPVRVATDFTDDTTNFTF